MGNYIVETVVTYKKISLKGMTGGWSKYGGARSSVLKKEIQDEWTCQSCARRLPKEITPYLYEFESKEYIRICAICLRNNCKDLKRRRNNTE